MTNAETVSPPSRSARSVRTRGATTRSSSRPPATRSPRTAPSASLEDIARRAQVGIGTLYRHFPTRQHLVEPSTSTRSRPSAASAAELADLPPWDALAQWLRAFVGFAATKRALAQELLATIDPDAEVFRSCRSAITTAGEALLHRAQAAGAVRRDADFTDIARLLGGLASVRSDPEEIDRLLDIVLDGLRYQAPGA